MFAAFATNLTIGVGKNACITPMASRAQAVFEGRSVPASMADMGMGQENTDGGKPSTHKPIPCDNGNLPVGCYASAGCASIPLVVNVPERTWTPPILSSFSVLKVVQPDSVRTSPEPPPPKSLTAFI